MRPAATRDTRLHASSKVPILNQVRYGEDARQGTSGHLPAPSRQRGVLATGLAETDVSGGRTNGWNTGDASPMSRRDSAPNTRGGERSSGPGSPDIGKYS